MQNVAKFDAKSTSLPELFFVRVPRFPLTQIARPQIPSRRSENGPTNPLSNRQMTELEIAPISLHPRIFARSLSTMKTAFGFRAASQKSRCVSPHARVCRSASRVAFLIVAPAIRNPSYLIDFIHRGSVLIVSVLHPRRAPKFKKSCRKTPPFFEFAAT
jgi:hypothetical protein